MTRQRNLQKMHGFRIRCTVRLGLFLFFTVGFIAPILAPTAQAQLQPGDIVALMKNPGGAFGTSPGVLLRVDPATGARTTLNNLGDGAQGPVGVQPEGLAVESPNSILVIDAQAGTGSRGALFRVIPSTGSRAIIHDFGDTSTGGQLGSDPVDVAMDPSGKIVVADTGEPDGLFRLQVESDGLLHRTFFSNFELSAQGDVLRDPKAIAVEADGNILVNAFRVSPNPSNFEKLYRIDPASGNRVLLSDIGTDPIGTSTQMNPVGLAVEADKNILVIDSAGGSIAGTQGVLWRVNPVSGNMSVVSEFDNLSQGPRGSEPLQVAVESSRTILVLDQSLFGTSQRVLFRIDPTSGNRSILSNFSAGTAVGGIPVGVAVVVPTVTLTAPDPSATENPNTTGTFRVSRTGPTSTPVEVFYTVGGTATSGADYTALSGSVTIQAGQSSADITVTPINDPLVEGTETVILTLSPRLTYTVGNPSSATVTITSEDKPVVAIVAPNPTTYENSPLKFGRFELSRTGLTDGDLSVSLSRSGTATAGSDYRDFSLVVTIPAGARTLDIAVIPKDDPEREAPETVVLTILPLPSYSVSGKNTATVTIISDESGRPGLPLPPNLGRPNK